DGDIYIGQWQDNMASGCGKYYHKGSTTYEGSWKKDMQDGFGVETWGEGARYEGSFKEGQKEGFGIYFWTDGSKYEGAWRDNVIDGAGLYVASDGRTFKGQWSDSMIHGVGKYDWPGGRQCDGETVRRGVRERPEAWLRSVPLARWSKVRGLLEGWQAARTQHPPKLPNDTPTLAKPLEKLGKLQRKRQLLELEVVAVFRGGGGGLQYDIFKCPFEAFRELQRPSREDGVTRMARWENGRRVEALLLQCSLRSCDVCRRWADESEMPTGDKRQVCAAWDGGVCVISAKLSMAAILVILVILIPASENGPCANSRWSSFGAP
ncbi:PIP5K1, partial [Symbiodinium necroappetens]